MRGEDRLAVPSGDRAVTSDGSLDRIDGGLVGVMGEEAVAQVAPAQIEGTVRFVQVAGRVEEDRRDRAGLGVEGVEEMKLHDAALPDHRSEVVRQPPEAGSPYATTHVAPGDAGGRVVHDEVAEAEPALESSGADRARRVCRDGLRARAGRVSPYPGPPDSDRQVWGT